MPIEFKIQSSWISNLKALLLVMVLASVSSIDLFAQLSDSKLKTIYTYQFVQNIEWPNEQTIDSLRIVVCSSNFTLIQDFMEIAKTKNLKNRPISIKIITELPKLAKPYPNVIYVEKFFNEHLLNLFKKIENHPVLVISEEYDNKDIAMINLRYVDKQNIHLEFEVNKYSIEEQHNLRVLPKLLLLGGSKTDAAILYKKQEELLGDAYEKVKEFQNEIENQQAIINSQDSEITKQRREIISQKNEILEQQTRIDSHRVSLNILLNKTERQKKLISDNLIILYENQKTLGEQQKQKIIDNEEISKRNEILEKQKSRIQNQQQLIDNQENKLYSQQKQLQTQKWLLFFSLVTVLLTIFLFILIYKSYKNKQKANRLLEEKNLAIQHKNIEIESQKEELQFMNEELKVTNRELSFQREEILAQNEEIIAQKNKLQIANATKDKFFSIIAHDLRNPFNLILGFSELLIDQLKDQNYAKSLTLAETITQTTSDAYTLLENLLSWSKSQTGQIPFNLCNLDLKEIIDSSILFFNNSAACKGINLNSLLTRSFIIQADKNMLLTIIRNLITNAIKFSRNNDQVIIEVEEFANSVAIHIKDTGVGIDETEIGKLFKVNEHFRTEGTANERGTGLGLILCKEFVERHNGEIWVESKKGIGSRFSFTLPKIKENIL